MRTFLTAAFLSWCRTHWSTLRPRRANTQTNKTLLASSSAQHMSGITTTVLNSEERSWDRTRQIDVSQPSCTALSKTPLKFFFFLGGAAQHYLSPVTCLPSYIALSKTPCNFFGGGFAQHSLSLVFYQPSYIALSRTPCNSFMGGLPNALFHQ